MYVAGLYRLYWGEKRGRDTFLHCATYHLNHLYIISAIPVLPCPHVDLFCISSVLQVLRTFGLGVARLCTHVTYEYIPFLTVKALSLPFPFFHVPLRIFLFLHFFCSRFCGLLGSTRAAGTRTDSCAATTSTVTKCEQGRRLAKNYHRHYMYHD